MVSHVSNSRLELSKLHLCEDDGPGNDLLLSLLGQIIDRWLSNLARHEFETKLWNCPFLGGLQIA